MRNQWSATCREWDETVKLHNVWVAYDASRPHDQHDLSLDEWITRDSLAHLPEVDWLHSSTTGQCTFLSEGGCHWPWLGTEEHNRGLTFFVRQTIALANQHFARAYEARILLREEVIDLHDTLTGLFTELNGRMTSLAHRGVPASSSAGLPWPCEGGQHDPALDIGWDCAILTEIARVKRAIQHWHDHFDGWRCFSADPVPLPDEVDEEADAAADALSGMAFGI